MSAATYARIGGARTIDAPLRPVQAELGVEHAELIPTVRSVGSRLGQSRSI